MMGLGQVSQFLLGLRTPVPWPISESLSHFNREQREAVIPLVKQFTPLFSDTPGLINLITHDMDICEATPIKQHYTGLTHRNGHI